MIKVKTKTLSFKYDPAEDRIKMVINKETAENVAFWITRRFYISMLFELETFLEQLNISYKDLIQSKQKEKTEKNKNKLQDKKDDEVFLLKNVNIRFIKEKKEFVFVFKSDNVEAESLVRIEQFLYLYSILKGCYPKKEWGII